LEHRRLILCPLERQRSLPLLFAFFWAGIERQMEFSKNKRE